MLIQITVQTSQIWHELYIKHTLLCFYRPQINLCAKYQLGEFDKILWKMAGFQTPGLSLLWRSVTKKRFQVKTSGTLKPHSVQGSRAERQVRKEHLGTSCSTMLSWARTTLLSLSAHAQSPGSSLWILFHSAQVKSELEVKLKRP